MNNPTITVHCVVKNEDKFVWYAINSVLPYVEKVFIYDTGSTDKIVEIVKSIKDPKIVFEEKGEVSPIELVNLRNEQIQKTKTDFFMILDGDEIWPKRSMEQVISCLESMEKGKLAVFCRTRNAVGDVFFYLPEDAGKYELGGMKGSLNLRFFRNVGSWRVTGRYPLEEFNYEGKPINILSERLQFVDTWYLHCTHLLRSGDFRANFDQGKPHQKVKYELGIKLPEDELPEVFLLQRPSIVSDPLAKRSISYLVRAAIETPLKIMKRKLFR